MLQKADDLSYKYYMSDCCKIIIQTIISLDKSKHEFPRFYDIVHHSQQKQMPEKSAEEIIAEVTKDAGLTAI